jgi:hypothetical protein
MATYDPDKKKSISVGGKEYPSQPSTLDYVKEAFEPTNVRANLEAIRKRRASQGQS